LKNLKLRGVEKDVLLEFVLFQKKITKLEERGGEQSKPNYKYLLPLHEITAVRVRKEKRQRKNSQNCLRAR